MAMRFPFRRFATPQPAVALGGQMFRHRPVVDVGVQDPTNTRAVRVLLDTGSDDTVFREGVAHAIGLDLTDAPTRYLTGIGPSGYRVRYAAVRLRLSDGLEHRDWPAAAGDARLRGLFAVFHLHLSRRPHPG